MEMGLNGKELDLENNHRKSKMDNRENHVNDMTSSQNIESSLPQQGSLCSEICCTFTERGLRHLYGVYTRRTRRESPCIFMLVSFLASLWSVITTAIVFNNVFLPYLIISSILCLGDMIFLIVFIIFKSRDNVVQFVVYYSYITFGLQILVNLILGELTVQSTDSLDWTLVFIYVTLVLVPMFTYQCVMMTVICIMIHLLTSSIISSRSNNEIYFSATLLVSQILLYIAVLILGLVTQHLINIGVRESFLESKDSLSVSLQIEESSKEQEQLLLSVLPKHVADEMLRDMGEEVEGQFRTIYMNRHENVSILFADIVGFTALSSLVTPSELVKILNDLFATFDKLAQKYCQLRIKILGDCYYCICGCPTPRSDHAVLSIHMGQAMVETISLLREKTKSGVNMRVGIHTGAVMGGVLGQVRWQYDVFGREVTMANKMESGGLPGRVHISEVTARCLNNEFELEPGEGETREDAIKMAGLKTYLIKQVLKPYPAGVLIDDNAKDVSETSKNPKANVISKEDTHGNNDKLANALMNREAKTHMNKELSGITLHFKDAKKEANFYQSSHKGWLNTIAMAAVTWLGMIALLVANGLNVFVLGTLLSGAIILSLLALFAYLSERSKGGCLTRFGMYINHSQLGQFSWALLCSITLLVTHFLSALGCSILTGGRYLTVPVVNDTLTTIYITMSGTGCLHPQLFTSVGVIVMLSVTSLTSMEYLAKSTICIVIGACYCLLHWLLMESYFDSHDLLMTNNMQLTEMAYKHSASISMILIAVGCILICRHLGRLRRKLYLYKSKMGDLQKQAETLKAKNEALVYNILPAHVAKDFIGVKRDDEELYSHAYEEVGVMFASCPNFNDFYSEDAVNNDGLECIRVLNEILSDYDDLLKSDRFHNITKIKTIGPTFMAASGMNVSVNKDEDVRTRWKHLADLVDFIMAMRESLDRINEQSFNNFMLRVGVNHGPILAGVIGAKKPHYDIWGNSVNVASRMDSTGQLGKVQVVESTMEILRHFGFTFEQRGLITVKGKGELMTYFLTGKNTK